MSCGEWAQMDGSGADTLSRPQVHGDLPGCQVLFTANKHALRQMSSGLIANFCRYLKILSIFIYDYLYMSLDVVVFRICVYVCVV